MAADTETADRAAIFEASLAAVAEIMGDPCRAVYARLFAEFPQFEALFWMDADEQARGHMLQEALDALADLAGGGAHGGHFIDSEQRNHEGHGVDAGQFHAFFRVVHDCFREGCGAAWTSEMEALWQELVAEAGRRPQSG